MLFLSLFVLFVIFVIVFCTANQNCFQRLTTIFRAINLRLMSNDIFPLIKMSTEGKLQKACTNFCIEMHVVVP